MITKTKISPQSVYLFRIKQFTILEFIFYGSSIKFDFLKTFKERRNYPKSSMPCLFPQYRLLLLKFKFRSKVGLYNYCRIIIICLQNRNTGIASHQEFETRFCFFNCLLGFHKIYSRTKIGKNFFPPLVTS